MNKINIDLTINNSLKEVTFNDNKILVKTYLPIEEKLNLIEVVMQNAIDFNFVNPVKTKAYFNAYVVIKYTNVDFSSYMTDVPALYDLVKRTGLLDLVINTIGDDYLELVKFCDSFVDKFENYQNSLYGMVSQLFSDIPRTISDSIEALGSLDLNKMQELFEVANKVGGSPAALAEAIVNAKDN